MCSSCVKEQCPDRESICLDSGSYMLNFAGCTSCGESGQINIVNKTVTEDGDEETTVYQHVCGNCNHLIANHEHTFRVEDEYQEFEMYCDLCGHGEDQRSVLPYDPRGPRLDSHDG